MLYATIPRPTTRAGHIPAFLANVSRPARLASHACPWLNSNLLGGFQVAIRALAVSMGLQVWLPLRVPPPNAPP